MQANMLKFGFNKLKFQKLLILVFCLCFFPMGAGLTSAILERQSGETHLINSAGTKLSDGNLASLTSSLSNTESITTQKHKWLDADGNPAPFQTDEELLEFLQTASVISMEKIAEGVAGTRRVLLEKDGIRMHAAFRDVHVEKNSVKTKDGKMQLFFRDDAMFECAAYELSRLLGLDNVPPTVSRRISGGDGSLQVWIEKAMTEKKRKRENIHPPNMLLWMKQIQMMRIFDNLIYNDDRNPGNMLIDSDWKLWMIDHTRAFRRYGELRYPRAIRYCERNLLEKLQSLDEATLKKHLKKFLPSHEINPIIERRDKLVALIQEMIQKYGKDNVLFSFE